MLHGAILLAFAGSFLELECFVAERPNVPAETCHAKDVEKLLAARKSKGRVRSLTRGVCRREAEKFTPTAQSEQQPNAQGPSKKIPATSPQGYLHSKPFEACLQKAYIYIYIHMYYIYIYIYSPPACKRLCVRHLRHVGSSILDVQNLHPGRLAHHLGPSVECPGNKEDGSLRRGCW